VATKLNLASGSTVYAPLDSPQGDGVSILPVAEAADEFLGVYPPGSDPRGQDREYGLSLKTQLDSYNTACPDEGSGGGNGGGNGNGNGNGNGHGGG